MYIIVAFQRKEEGKKAPKTIRKYKWHHYNDLATIKYNDI